MQFESSGRDHGLCCNPGRDLGSFNSSTRLVLKFKYFSQCRTFHWIGMLTMQHILSRTSTAEKPRFMLLESQHFGLALAFLNPSGSASAFFPRAWNGPDGPWRTLPHLLADRAGGVVTAC
jgi:hypothetical protein